MKELVNTLQSLLGIKIFNDSEIQVELGFSEGHSTKDYYSLWIMNELTSVLYILNFSRLEKKLPV